MTNLLLNKGSLRAIGLALLLLVGCAVKEINYDEGLYKGHVKENFPDGEGKY